VRDSRVLGTRHVVEAGPQALVCASGVDYYPFDESERAYDETAPAGDSFLAEVCVAWEAEARRAQGRVVTMRTGLVLARGAPAVTRILQPFRMFVGGPIGSGRQWFSWVHLEDVVGAYLLAVEGDLDGAVNVVAPEPVRQAEFARAVGRALRRPAAVRVPSFALRAGLGELAEYALHGRRAVPAALARVGFAFRFGDLAGALQSIL
jgi:uncharacterized protein (TIGR01777 family)